MEQEKTTGTLAQGNQTEIRSKRMYADATVQNILAANIAILKKTHSQVAGNGYSRATADDTTSAILTPEEAKKAIALGVHIGVISEFEDYHGSRKGTYSFSPIMEEKAVDDWSKKLKHGKISIDPVYEYEYMEENAIRLSDIKVLVQQEMKKDEMILTGRMDEIIAINKQYSFDAAKAEMDIRERNKINYAVNESFRFVSNDELRAAVSFMENEILIPNIYSEPEFKIHGTTEELFLQAGNGYINDPDALHRVREILIQENRTGDAEYVGFMEEREREFLEYHGFYTVAQMKLDFMKGKEERVNITTREGLRFSVGYEKENDSVSVCVQHRGNGETINLSEDVVSISLDEFKKMNREDFDDFVGKISKLEGKQINEKNFSDTFENLSEDVVSISLDEFKKMNREDFDDFVGKISKLEGKQINEKNFSDTFDNVVGELVAYLQENKKMDEAASVFVMAAYTKQIEEKLDKAVKQISDMQTQLNSIGPKQKNRNTGLFQYISNVSNEVNKQYCGMKCELVSIKEEMIKKSSDIIASLKQKGIGELERVSEFLDLQTKLDHFCEMTQHALNSVDETLRRIDLTGKHIGIAGREVVNAVRAVGGKTEKLYIGENQSFTEILKKPFLAQRTLLEQILKGAQKMEERCKQLSVGAEQQQEKTEVNQFEKRGRSR